MSEADTLPAGAEAESAPSISSILETRHQAQGAHEPHREVGAASEGAPQAQPEPTSPQPAPQAATPAPQAQPQADPAGQAGEPDPATDPRSPKWYREHMAKVNREMAELRRRAEQPPPAPQPQPQPGPQLSAEELQRPLTVAEMLDFQRRFQDQQQQFATNLQVQTNLRNSEYWARQKHGDLFDEAFAWLDTQPDLQDHFLRQPDPWGSAIAHYQRVKLAEEIGDDPRAWQENQREKIRQELLAEMNAAPAAEAQPTPAMRPQINRPAPPQPASTVRSAQPRDDAGRFSGPTPVSSILPNKF